MQELKRRGHQVKAFFPDSGFPGADYHKYYGDKDTYHIVKFPVTYEGVDLYTFPLIIRDPNPRNYEQAWTFKDLTERELEAYFKYIRQELEQVIAEFAPDVIECQHVWAIDHLLKDMGYHYICVAHHSDQLGFLFDERMSRRALQSAESASYIFAVSDFVKDEVLELYQVPPEKVIVTGNGYNQSIFELMSGLDRERVLADLGCGKLEEHPLITFCGKISATKGIDILLEANKIIQEKKKAYILLMGSGNLDALQKKSGGRFHMENVIYLGQRSQMDLAKLHNIAALSVLPSRTEGFGIAALEAMGCGKPVVYTNAGGLASFAVGRMVEKENPHELAQSILQILSLEEIDYRELCRHAYSAAQKHSWESIVDIRMKYYSEIYFLNRGKRI